MWYTLDTLHKIDKDIAEYGYKESYANKYGLDDNQTNLWGSSESGVRNISEPIKIKLHNGKVMWKSLPDYNWLGEERKTFKTQLGVFDNEDRGEFGGSLYIHGRKKSLIDGNFCDMFDFGEYTYAISNLLHLWSGTLKIVRLDKNLGIKILFNNEFQVYNFTSYEYLGHTIIDDVCYIIASGNQEYRENGRQMFKEKTVVFKVDINGNFDVFKEFNFTLSYVTSLCMLNNCIYFGRNREVTKLNLETGVLEHYTHKDEEALNNLVSLDEVLLM